MSSAVWFRIKILSVIYEGAFAVYLEPWHADIFEFLDLRKNHGKVRYSNWIQVIYMLKKVYVYELLSAFNLFLQKEVI